MLGHLASMCCLVTCGLLIVALSDAQADQEGARSPSAESDRASTADNQAVYRRGAAVYAKQCAECHGEKGQGVEGLYDKALGGERSLPWLTRRIERTMPEGEAHLCVGEDAAAVATYLYRNYYARDAKAKQAEPGRRELQRLTAEQHRQSLADLIGSFRKPKAIDDRRGLQATYFKDGKMWGKPIGETIEPNADLVFTPEHRLAEQFDPKGHSVRLIGSLLVPETGEYEFVIRSDRAVRLWLNDGKAQGGGAGNEFAETDPSFIDGWVKSEGVTTFRGKMFLLGGRAYPLLLDFSARNQGVQRDVNPDQKNRPETYVSLRWVMPGRGEQVIDQRYLSPVRSREVFVTHAVFPPDDSSRGYERGVGVSPAWLEGVTDAAVDTATYVVDHFGELAGSDVSEADAAQRARTFLHFFVGQAFRAPLSETERAALVDDVLAAAPDLSAGIKRVVLSALASPRFLYPDLHSKPDSQHAIAARLALALRNGLPDKPLRLSAAKGELSEPLVLRQHAERLADDPRAAAKLIRFFHHWLELDRAEYVAKDAELFPEFDEALLTDLRTSLDLMIESVVFGESSNYRELLLAETLYLNARLAGVYGLERGESAGEGFVPVTATDGQRSGVITHPYLLSVFAYHNNTSPIHRGVFLTRNIVGRPLKPPPEAVAFEDHDFDPSLTMRQKVTEITRAQACMACHATINPLGFSLEHYDAIGRWRETEKNKPINPRSDFTDDDGQTMKLAGARDVALFAAQSDQARRGFVRQLFHHTAKRDPAELGLDALDQLDRRFVDSQTHIRRLLIEIALAEATLGLSLDTADQAADPDDGD